MHYCSKCGAEIKPGTKFCGKCGKEITTVKPENDRTIESETVENSMKKSNRFPIVATLIVLVIGVVIGVMVIFPRMTEHRSKISQEASEEDDNSYNNEGEELNDTGDIFAENQDASSEESEISSQSYYDDTEQDDENMTEEEDYILPDSDSKNYSMSDLKKLSAEEARLARNEIYARRGRKFCDEELQDYFEQKSWYQGTIEPDQFDDDTMLNSYEIYNRNLIVKYEKKLNTQGKKKTVSINEKYIKNITATSELSENGMVHNAKRICDGSLQKAWVEGVSGQGIGESITFILKKKCIIKGFRINAGYQKSEELYYKNSRPKAIDIYFSSGEKFRFDLEDYYGAQNFEFDSPIIAKNMTIEIVSVYEGNLYEDTVVSELQWY